MALTIGYRVSARIWRSAAILRRSWPSTAKASTWVDTLAIGVDRIQRNFEPLQCQVESWRQTQITDDRAKLTLYEASWKASSEAPRSLLPQVYGLHFNPQYPEFAARTIWSLSNAFTSAFKTLNPIP